MPCRATRRIAEAGDDDATADRAASGSSKGRATTTTVEDIFDDPEPAEDPLDRSACDIVEEADMHAITRYPGTTAASGRRATLAGPGAGQAGGPK